MALLTMFETIVAPAFAYGAGDMLLGALAVVGSAVLASDGKWSSQVKRVPIIRRVGKQAKTSTVVSVAGAQLQGASVETYGEADSQSAVLQRFNDLKHYVESGLAGHR
jgi:hypothetical protein